MRKIQPRKQRVISKEWLTHREKSKDRQYQGIQGILILPSPVNETFQASGWSPGTVDGNGTVKGRPSRFRDRDCMANAAQEDKRTP
jgi:hypothetical protein